MTEGRARRRVAVTGVGVLSALGCTVEGFIDSLRAGRSGIRKSLRLPPAVKGRLAGEAWDFRPEDYFSSKDAREMDRGVCMALAATRNALADSGINWTDKDADSAGVALGSIEGGRASLMRLYSKYLVEGCLPDLLGREDVSESPGMRICRELGIDWHPHFISTACSSSGISVGMGADWIVAGDRDLVLAGGVEPLFEGLAQGFDALDNVDPEGCRPFDKNRKGLTVGEASVIFVLEEWERAHARGARIWGEIKGYGLSSDAYHMTLPELSGSGFALAMENALRDAGLSERDIGYVNAHGSGTVPNDAAETRAIKKVFGAHAKKLAISSTKSMAGHTFGACGALGIAAALVSLYSGFVPPTLNYSQPDPECDLDYVPNASRDSDAQYAMCNSFGFGGNNCSVIIEKGK